MIHWHRTHADGLTTGERLADKTAAFMGSWRFIVMQSVVVALWMAANAIGMVYQWDAYPFILLNLLFSVQAAYAAPIIMMAQNRQGDRDRHHAEADYRVNLTAERRIEALQLHLARIENDKLDELLRRVGQPARLCDGQSSFGLAENAGPGGERRFAVEGLFCAAGAAIAARSRADTCRDTTDCHGDGAESSMGGA